MRKTEVKGGKLSQDSRAKEKQSWDLNTSIQACLVIAMVFSVVMYECESWTIKKAEYHRIDAFELWYWRRLLRVPWIARDYIQPVHPKKISPEYSLEGLM